MSMGGGGGGGSEVDWEGQRRLQEQMFEYQKEVAEPWVDAGANRALPALLYQFGLGPQPFLTNDGQIVYRNEDGSVMAPAQSAPTTESPYAKQISDMEGWRNETGQADGEPWSWWHSGYDRPYTDEEYNSKLGRLREMDSMWTSLRGQNQQSNASGSALASLPDGATPLGEYTKTPGYDFRLQEGNRGVLSAMNAAGAGKDSGATYSALARFNQDYATNDYNRHISGLSQIAGYGQFGAGLTSQAAGNYAQGSLQTAMAQQSAYDAAQERNASAMGGLGSLVGTLAGGGIGYAIGGPAGAFKGASLGGGVFS